MNNVTATATGGAATTAWTTSSSSPTIRNSSISGTTYSILNEGSTAQVADHRTGWRQRGRWWVYVVLVRTTTAFVALPGNCDND